MKRDRLFTGLFTLRPNITTLQAARL